MIMRLVTPKEYKLIGNENVFAPKCIYIAVVNEQIDKVIVAENSRLSWRKILSKNWLQVVSIISSLVTKHEVSLIFRLQANERSKCKKLWQTKATVKRSSLMSHNVAKTSKTIMSQPLKFLGNNRKLSLIQLESVANI